MISLTVQRPAAVTPDTAEKRINLAQTFLSISLVGGADGPAFEIACLNRSILSEGLLSRSAK